MRTEAPNPYLRDICGLRRSIEHSMDEITDAYRKANRSYHELIDLMYECEELVDMWNFIKKYDKEHGELVND